jgi:hypothetical protein
VRVTELPREIFYEAREIMRNASSPGASVGSIPPTVPTLVSRRVVGSALAVLLVSWSILLWTKLRPPDLVSDWNGWRQADTQTIALNFTRAGSQLLFPQISWGGDGPGYVETELQLYTKIVALAMGVFGQAEWPGQLVSLLATVATAWVVFIHLGRSHTPLAAAFGVLAFLSTRTSVHLATVVMPDSLALLAYASAWSFFVAYCRNERTRDLVLFGVIGSLAMLTKPTTAHIGVSTFLYLIFTGRSPFRNYRVLLTWGAMLAALALYLWHAHGLYADYGNTFGLLAGEDSKTPRLRHLLMPAVYQGALKNMLGWGVGYGAALAFLFLALRRKLNAEHYALAIGNVLITLVALRYMSQDAGNYYFAPMSVLAAIGVAGAADELSNFSRKGMFAGFAVLSLLLCVQAYRNLKLRHTYANFSDPEVASVVGTGRELSRLTRPNDLVVVRSPNEAYDVFWESGRNYHEPRIFYISQTRGWTLGREQPGTTLVADARRKGARYLVDPLSEGHPELDAWLTREAKLIWSQPRGGRIWSLE